MHIRASMSFSSSLSKIWCIIIYMSNTMAQTHIDLGNVLPSVIVIVIMIIVVIVVLIKKSWRIQYSKTSSKIDTSPSVCIKLNKEVDISDYGKVEKRFKEQWTKMTPCYPVPPTPLAIYDIQNDALANRYQQYKNKTFSESSESNEEWHFHGTSMKCNIVHLNKWCDDKSCGICGISRNGFDLSFIRTNRYQRFGKGIYLAPNSSKSNDYAATDNQYRYKAQLLCLVACGNKYVLHDDATSLVAPPASYHSVYGKASAEGKLNYDEVVVYDADAVIPQFIIVYDTWSQSKSSGLQEMAVTVSQLNNKPVSSHTVTIVGNQKNPSYARHSLADPPISMRLVRGQSLSNNTSTHISSKAVYSQKQYSSAAGQGLSVSTSTNDSTLNSAASYYARCSRTGRMVTPNAVDKDLFATHQSSPVSASIRSNRVASQSLDKKLVRPSEMIRNSLNGTDPSHKPSANQRSMSQYDQFQCSPTTTGKSGSATSFSRYKVEKQKRKSRYNQSRHSPSISGDVTSLSEGKGMSKTWYDQCLSFIQGRISIIANYSYSEEEQKSKGQNDQSWKVTEVDRGKQKSKSGYDRHQSSKGKLCSATSTPEYDLMKQKTKSQYGQSWSSPSIATRQTSGCAPPWSKQKVDCSKQKSKSQCDQFQSSPILRKKSGSATSSSGYEIDKQKRKSRSQSSLSTSGGASKHSEDKEMSKSLYDQCSSFICSIATPWSKQEQKSKDQNDQSRKVPEVDHGKQKSKSRYDRYRSSPLSSGKPGSSTSWSGYHVKDKQRSKSRYGQSQHLPFTSGGATLLSEPMGASAGHIRINSSTNSRLQRARFRSKH